jgi:RecB family exonuclease
MNDISTNPYERKARDRKAHRLADALELAATMRDIDNLGVVADMVAELDSHEWESLEYLAGTRPQKTQDKPASDRTRQLTANKLLHRQRRKDREILVG